MIKSFRDRRTAEVWAGIQPKGIGPALAKQARRTLGRLDAATMLLDLRGEGLKLEALHRDRIGEYAIRVSSQFRICFV